MASAFKVGDLVWAKMKGFPPWPGLVSDPPDTKKLNEKKPKFYIFFFGSENYAWVTFDNMWLYLEKREEYLAMLRPTHSFQEAVDAIDDYVREHGGIIPEAPKKSPQKQSDNEEEKTASGRRSRKRHSTAFVLETPTKSKADIKPKSVKKDTKKSEDKKEIKEKVKVEEEKKEKSKIEVDKKDELKAKKLNGDDDDEDDDGVELKSKRISRKRNDDEEEDEDEDFMDGVIEGGYDDSVDISTNNEILKERRESEDGDDEKNEEDESVEKMLVGEDKVKKMSELKGDDVDAAGRQDKGEGDAKDKTKDDDNNSDLNKEELNKSSKKERNGKFDPRESAKKPTKPQTATIKSPSTITPKSPTTTTKTPTTTTKNPTTTTKTPTTTTKNPTTITKTPTTTTTKNPTTTTTKISASTKTPATTTTKNHTTITKTPTTTTKTLTATTKTPATTTKISTTTTPKMPPKEEGVAKKKENGVAMKRKSTVNDKKTNSSKKPTYLPDVLSSTTEPTTSNKPTTIPKLNKKFTTIIPTKKKIGFIGCGNMGSRLVANLLASRHQVMLWNRTPSKCKELIKKGASKCSSACEVVKRADIIITCVSDAVAFRDVVYGSDGVLQEMREGKGFVNLSTVDVETNLDACEAVNSRGGLYLEAAMLGSLKTAAKGELLVLASGDQGLYDQCNSLFKAISKDIFNLVDIGTATKMQVVFNSLYGTTLAGLAEGLSLASKVGIDPAEVLEVVSHTSVVSQLIRTKGEAMVKNKVNDVDIKLDTLQRHIRLAINMSEEVDQPLHVGSVVNELFKKAKAKGYGDCDVSAVYRATDL